MGRGRLKTPSTPRRKRPPSQNHSPPFPLLLFDVGKKYGAKRSNGFAKKRSEIIQNLKMQHAKKKLFFHIWAFCLGDSHTGAEEKKQTFPPLPAALYAKHAEEGSGGTDERRGETVFSRKLNNHPPSPCVGAAAATDFFPASHYQTSSTSCSYSRI